METRNDQIEFASAIKYAFALRFGAPYSPKDVPTIGIVFGSLELATQCQEYIGAAYDNDELRIEIALGVVTARVELREVNEDKTVLVAELNYDEPELREFEGKTSPAGRVALIFGFKRGCDYYVTGNAKDSAADFSPIVLAGFSVNH